jgi:hypothetical protein
MSENRPRGYRSLFWPMILIGVGVVWLLANLGWLPTNSLWLLLNLWPLLLVGIGLDLIFARRLPVLGALIGLALVAVVVVVLLLGPSLNLPMTAGPETRTLTVPLEQNKSAVIQLELSSYPSNIHALPASSANLFDGTVHYTGTLNFSAQASNGTMNIHLSQSGFPSFIFNPGGFGSNLDWNIGLSPKIPLTLTVDAGSGSSDIDLTGLQLSSLRMDAASGSSHLTLPTSTQPYSVDYSAASGSADISLPANTSLTLRLDGASGSINLRLPPNPAVRVEVQDSGSGSVNVPGSLNRQSGGSGKTGAWESASYASAAQRILIVATNLGSGSFNID